MTISFYMNSSENLTVSKTLTHLSDMQGTFRAETDTLSPEVLIAADYTALSTQIGNYAFISETKRYYFIVDIKIVREGLVRISLRTDVLMSFKDDILKLSAIVARQEKTWNLYLSDSYFKTYQNSKIQLKAFSNGFTTPNGYTWILVTAGG